MTVLSGSMLVALAFTPVLTGGSRPGVRYHAAQSSRIAAAVATAAQFHQFLARGDSANAVRLLAPDAVVLESGERETRAEYVAHHLRADIEFVSAVPTTRTVVDTRRQGEVVWVVATSVTKGKFRDRQIDLLGAELMVLSRSGERWVIRAIHWSSRRPAP